MDDRIKSSDWQCAFEYAGPGDEDAEGYRPNLGSPSVSPILGWEGDASGFTREDVAEILAIDDGCNDEESWVGLFRLKDGRYAFLSASCDFTGWDCQAGGHAFVGGDLESMVRYGLGAEDRERLKAQLALHA